MPYTLLGFTLNDGVQTLNAANSQFSFNLNVNADGAITYYYFNAQANGGGNAGPMDIYGSSDGHHSFAGGDYGSLNYGYAGGGTLSVIDTPGSFTALTSVTPEPSSLALLGTGLLSVFGVVRRRLV